MRKYLFFCIITFNVFAGDTFDPKEIVDGVGEPVTCEDIPTKEPCQLTCENAVKAAKLWEPSVSFSAV